MKLKMLALCFVLLAILPGCQTHTENTSASSQPVQITPTVGGAETGSAETTGPTVPPSSLDTPDAPSTPSYQDTYHSGKPYAQWGTPCNFTLASDSGKTICLTGNLPEESIGVLKRKYLWHGNTDDLNTAYMVGYFDADLYAIQQPKTFFDDIGESFLEQYYKLFQIGAKDVTIDIRDTVTVTKHGLRMCRFVGAAQWTASSASKENSFVAYVFQEPSGGYLCCLFQCKKKNWALTQEIAENYINTLIWEVSNAG